MCFLRLQTVAVRPGPAAVVVASAAGSTAAVACLGVGGGFGWVLVCHMDSRALFRGRAAAEADVVAVVADVEEVRFQVVGSVAVASGLKATHTVVAGYQVEEGSAVAAAAAVVAQEETMEVADTIDRLAEAQSTAADRAVDLSHVSEVW